MGPTQAVDRLLGSGLRPNEHPRPQRLHHHIQQRWQLNAKADCNNACGAQSTDCSSITLSVQTSTTAMCPPESLSEQDLSYLNGARTYTTGPDSLRLDLVADSGSRFFEKWQGRPAAGRSYLSGG